MAPVSGQPDSRYTGSKERGFESHSCHLFCFLIVVGAGRFGSRIMSLFFVLFSGSGGSAAGGQQKLKF